jgi:hypothetical protein
VDSAARACSAWPVLAYSMPRPPIVALGLVGSAEAQMRLGVHDAISASRGEREGALRRGNGLVMRAHRAEMV